MPFVSALFASRRAAAAAFSRLLGAVLLGVACLAAVAQDKPMPTDPDAALDELRHRIDTAQKTVAGSGLTDSELTELRSRALDAQSQAADIATRLAPQLSAIDARIAELGTPVPGTKEDGDVAAQRSLLAKNRGEVDGQIKLARLLAVEGGQVVTQSWAARRAAFQARLGERTPSVLAATFWSELIDDLPDEADRFAAQRRSWADAAASTPLAVWLLLPILFAAAVWGLWRLFDRLMLRLMTRGPKGRLRRSLAAVLVTLMWTASVGVFALGLNLAFSWHGRLPAADAAVLGKLTGMIWFGGFVYGLMTALVSAKKPSWRLPPLPDSVAAKLRWYPLMVSVVLVATWLAEQLATLVNAGLSLVVAVNCFVALALGLTMALGVMSAERAWHLEITKDKTRPRPLPLAILASLNWLVLVVAVASVLVGYVAFGSTALKQLLWATIVFGAGYLLAAVIDDALGAWLAGNDVAIDDGQIEAAPDTVAHTPAQLAVLLSGLLRLVLILVALMLLIAPFGEGPADLMRRGLQWQQGLSVGDFKLQPGAVLQALAVLLLSIGAVKVLSRWLSERYLPTTSLDAGMRSSAASLFGYAGIVIAVALSLSAMGIGLERIAWVASALSVGIGFGLQAVVQNFVSGLILLAEQPVKVGDWVSLGGVEGDIRRINVRATEIQMGDRSTVIVPNSEFITKVVRNVTHANPLGLVQLKLPVPIGTDAQQVRELLMSIFEANGDLLEAPAPAVALDGIEGGQLTFNATGFVDSPRKAYNVKSALLFEVLARFEEAGITLAKPPTLLMAAPDAAAAASGSDEAPSRS